MLMPVTPAQGREKQDLKFKAALGYLVVMVSLGSMSPHLNNQDE